MASIKLDNLKFKKILDEYQDILGKTLPECVRINARLLAVELARRTQPFGNSDKTKQVSDGAIARDLLGGKKRAGLFAPITPWIAQNAEEYSTGNIRLFVKKNGEVYGTDKAHFLHSATAGTLRSIHKEAFKNGKLSSAGGKTRDIGRWKFINKHFVPAETLAKYVASVQAKVGLAKSGWAACAKQLKTGKSAGTRGIPGWVTKHLGDYTLGNVQDRTDNEVHPHVILTNTSKYIDKVLNKAQQLEALANVGARMKKQMETVLKKRNTQLAEAA